MASNRKSKSEREREKLEQDRLQILLTRMLQDDDNKYCVDCDAKGPRWASWNLGIFLCIRCAGIHRNLGVHISKVKSVNLDSWTPHQVASMQIMGNSRARAIYEAQVSEEFRRPQTDPQLEVFIRTKYEKKKYIAREWVPTKTPEYPLGWNELIEAEKQKRDLRSVMVPQSSSPTKSPATTTPRPISSVQNKEPTKESSSINALSSDLFAMSVGTNQGVSKPSFSSDLLGLGDGEDLFGLASTPSDLSHNNLFNNFNNNNNAKDVSASTDKKESQLFSLDFTLESNGSQGNPEKLSKDSILALFNKPSAPLFQQQNFSQESSSALHQKHFSMSGFGLPQPISGKDSSFLEVQNSFMGIVEPSTPSQIGATGSQAVPPLSESANSFAFF